LTETEKTRLHAVIAGRVQGVGFRAFVERKAANLGLTGWVRNRWDGTVELVAEGDRPILDQFLAALRRGPAGAMVTQVKQEWQAATGEFWRFSVKSTF
jgi:acylphosphatase